METAIVSLICIALIIIGGMTMSQGFLTSMDSTSVAFEELGSRDERIMRTELTPVSALAAGEGETVIVTLKNTGQTQLADFEKWDVIIQYYDSSGGYHTNWLPYGSSGPYSNEWMVAGIRLNGNPETIEPDILNPGETIELEALLSPAVGDNTTNLVVVSTSNGIPASVAFLR